MNFNQFKSALHNFKSDFMSKKNIISRFSQLLIVLLAISSTLSAQTGCLKGHYSFDGNAKDILGNLSEGKVFGPMLTSDRFGHDSAAYFFDGIDDYLLLDSTIFDTLIITMWYKSENSIDSGVHFCQPGRFEILEYPDYDNDLYYDYFNFNVSNNQGSSAYLSSNQVFTQGYQFVAYKIIDYSSGVLIEFYLNGRLIASDTQLTGPLHQSTGSLSVGIMTNEQDIPLPWSENFFYGGYIDDIKIYTCDNIAIDSLYHAEMYENPISTTCFDTVVTQVTDSIIVTTYDTVYTHITVEDTLNIVVPTGLAAPNDLTMILVYPNPASTFITIDNGDYQNISGYSIIIYNELGQPVFNQVINQALFSVDISTWPNGSYFLQVENTTGNIVESKYIVLQ